MYYDEGISGAKKENRTELLRFLTHHMAMTTLMVKWW